MEQQLQQPLQQAQRAASTQATATAGVTTCSPSANCQRTLVSRMLQPASDICTSLKTTADTAAYNNLVQFCRVGVWLLLIKMPVI